MNATKIRPITANNVKTNGSALFGHSWNIYVGPSRDGIVLRAHAARDDNGEWIVTTKDDLNAEPVEVARVKTLKSVREVFAWIYNDMAGAEQPSLSEILESASKTARRKAAPAVSPAEAGIKVGTIFYSSWGYDQTTVDFYEVVGLTPKGVKIRKIAQSTEHEGYGQDRVSAEAGRFVGEVETKILRGSSSHPYLSLTSYSSASVWDGSPRYQTAFGYGH